MVLWLEWLRQQSAKLYCAGSNPVSASYKEGKSMAITSKCGPHCGIIPLGKGRTHEAHCQEQCCHGGGQLVPKNN